MGARVVVEVSVVGVVRVGFECGCACELVGLATTLRAKAAAVVCWRSKTLTENQRWNFLFLF